MKLHYSGSSSSSSSATGFRDQHHLVLCHRHSMHDGALLRCSPACSPNSDSKRRKFQSEFSHMCSLCCWHHTRSENETWAEEPNFLTFKFTATSLHTEYVEKRKWLRDTISVISTMTAGCPSAVQGSLYLIMLFASLQKEHLTLGSKMRVCCKQETLLILHFLFP